PRRCDAPGRCHRRGGPRLARHDGSGACRGPPARRAARRGGAGAVARRVPRALRRREPRGFPSAPRGRAARTPRVARRAGRHDRAWCRPARDARGHRRRRARRRDRRTAQRAGGRRLASTAMAELLRIRKTRVLAIYAHPDDLEISCGGALLRWAAAGSETYLLTCTQGDKGTVDVHADPDELAAQRAEEAEAAARVLGAAGHHSLGYPDGEITNDPKLRGRIVEYI